MGKTHLKKRGLKWKKNPSLGDVENCGYPLVNVYITNWKITIPNV
jgi:hypothetical protein